MLKTRGFLYKDGREYSNVRNVMLCGVHHFAAPPLKNACLLFPSVGRHRFRPLLYRGRRDLRGDLTESTDDKETNKGNFSAEKCLKKPKKHPQMLQESLLYNVHRELQQEITL